MADRTCLRFDLTDNVQLSLVLTTITPTNKYRQLH